MSLDSFASRGLIRTIEKQLPRHGEGSSFRAAYPPCDCRSDLGEPDVLPSKLFLKLVSAHPKQRRLLMVEAFRMQHGVIRIDERNRMDE